MTSQSETPSSSGDPIDIALEAFQNAWFAGKRPDPETFCEEHAECGPELRQQIETFLLAVDLLPEIGSSETMAESSADVDESLAFPGKEIGDFKIISKIGRGGMGVVYEAEQISLKRKVALKVLPAHMTLSGEAIKKFHREAEAGGRQKHPGIVAVYAMGEHDGLHYIVQELIEGRQTLADRVVEMKRLPTLPRGYYRDVAKLNLKVAEALAHAHASGVIHRDVKPSNILLTETGEPKVSDFGLAMIENALALSSTGSFAGTPYYMSPEQASGKRSEIDARTDVFSLGVTLYELLTLSLPFEGDTSHEVLKKIIIEEPRDPCRRSKRIPNDLAVICLKALEKDPGHRYDSMRDFADDLGRFLNNEPIRAKRAGALKITLKKIRRHPARSALSLMGLGFVTLLIILTVQKITYEKREQERMQLLAAEGLISKNPGKALNQSIEGCLQYAGEKWRNILVKSMSQCHEQKNYALPKGQIPIDVHWGEDSILALLMDESGQRVSVWNAESSDFLFEHDSDGLILKGAISDCGNKVAVLTEIPNESSENKYLITVWDSNTGNILTTLDVVTGKINSFCFNKDGSWIASVGNDLRLRTWESDTGRIIVDTPSGHPWHLTDAAFDGSGNRLAISSVDGTVSIWDTQDWTRVESICPGNDAIKAISFSNSGDYLALYTSHLRIWNIRTNEEEFRIHNETDLIETRFCHDDESLLTIADNSIISLWNFKLGREIRSVQQSIDKVNKRDKSKLYQGFNSMFSLGDLKGHSSRIITSKFNREGDKIVSCSLDGSIRIWSVKPGIGIKKIEAPDKYSHIAINIEGTKRAIVSDDSKEITIEDIDNDTTFQVGYESGWVEKVDFETVGYSAFYNEEHKSIQLTSKIDKGEDCVNDSAYMIRYSRFSPCGSRLFLFLDSNIIQVVDTADGDIIDAFRVHGDPECIDLFDDGSKVLITLASGNVQIHDLEMKTGKLIGDDILPSFRKVRHTRDGSKVLTLTNKGLLSIWNADFSEETSKLEECNCIDFWESSDQQRILTISEDQDLVIWNSDLTKKDYPPFSLHCGNLISRYISDDGSRLAVLDENSRLSIYRLDEGESPEYLDAIPEKVERAVFCEQKGGLIAFGTKDNRLIIWDISAEETLWSKSFQKTIEHIGYIPTGRNLSIAMNDGEVHFLPISPLDVVKDIEIGRSSDNSSVDSPKEAESSPQTNQNGNAIGIPKVIKATDCLLLEDGSQITSGLPEQPRGELYFTLPADKQPKDRVVIYKLGAKANSAEKIEEIPIPYDSWKFDIRKDGTMCYVHNQEEESTVHIFDLVRRETRVVYRDKVSRFHYPKWSPDADKIYFTSTPRREWLIDDSIRWIDAGGEPDQEAGTLLRCKDQKFLNYDISSDGSKICFIHSPVTNYCFFQEVWIADIENNGSAVSNPVRLTYDHQADRSCKFTSDNRSICWVTNDVNLPAELHRMTLNGENREILLRFETIDQMADCLFSCANGFLIFHYRCGEEDRIISFDPASGRFFEPYKKDGFKCLYPVFLTD